jgi:hypothetical protein
MFSTKVALGGNDGTNFYKVSKRLSSEKWVCSYSFICTSPYMPIAASSKSFFCARGTPMEEVKTEGVERLCHAVSPNDEPCAYPVTVHCAKCGRWFCDAHAEDEEWHTCMLPR